MTKRLEMRKLSALIVLLRGAASADAAEGTKWCSYGDPPAQIIYNVGASSWPYYTMTVGDKVSGGPEDSWDTARIFLKGAEAEEGGAEQTVFVIHDRIFCLATPARPCSIQSITVLVVLPTTY
jgi:hypothetical protein